MSEIDHGSRAGYAAHRRAGEDPCDACREAAATYQRERRHSKKKAAVPELSWPGHPASHDRLISYLAIQPAPGSVKWCFEKWAMNPDTRERWLLWGALESVKPGRGLERVREIVDASRDDISPIKVVVMSHDEVVFFLARHPEWRTFLESGIKVVHAEDLPRDDPKVGVHPILEMVFEEGKKHLPESAPGTYLERKHRQLAGRNGTDTLIADWLAEMSLPMIVHAAKVLEPRRYDAPSHQARGAVVARGRMMDVEGQTRSEPVYEDLPGNHPARLQETYLVTSARRDRR